MRGAQFFHERFDARLDFVGDHVGQAVDDVNRRIEFREQVGHFGFHFSIAGKTEVDGRIIEFPAKNRTVHHAGARRGKSLQNGSAVKDDRLALTRAPRRGFFNDDIGAEIPSSTNFVPL